MVEYFSPKLAAFLDISLLKFFMGTVAEIFHSNGFIESPQCVCLAMRQYGLYLPSPIVMMQWGGQRLTLSLSHLHLIMWFLLH